MSDADPTAPKPLEAPLAVWHESLFSARHDRLVALHPDGGVIGTSRPLPDGANVFLELSLGTQSNAPKAEIDAVVIKRGDVDQGFYVRFVDLDPAVSLWIERYLMGAQKQPFRAATEERRGRPAPDPAPADAAATTPPAADEDDDLDVDLDDIAPRQEPHNPFATSAPDAPPEVTAITAAPPAAPRRAEPPEVTAITAAPPAAPRMAEPPEVTDLVEAPSFGDRAFGDEDEDDGPGGTFASLVAAADVDDALRTEEAAALPDDALDDASVAQSEAPPPGVAFTEEADEADDIDMSEEDAPVEEATALSDETAFSGFSDESEFSAEGLAFAPAVDSDVPVPLPGGAPVPASGGLPAAVAAHASVTIGSELDDEEEETVLERPRAPQPAPEPGPLPPVVAAHASVTLGELSGEGAPGAPEPVTGVFPTAPRPPGPPIDLDEAPAPAPPAAAIETLPLDALSPVEPEGHDDDAPLELSPADLADDDDPLDLDVVDGGPMQATMGVPSMEGAPLDVPELVPVDAPPAPVDAAPAPRPGTGAIPLDVPPGASFSLDDEEDGIGHDVTVPDHQRSHPSDARAAAPVVSLPGPPPKLASFEDEDGNDELTREAVGVDPAALFAESEPVEGDVPLWDFEPEDSSARYPLAPAGTPEQETHDRLKHLFFSGEPEGPKAADPAPDDETREVTQDSLEVLPREHGHTEEAMATVTVAFTEEASESTYDGVARSASAESSGEGPASVDFGPPTLLHLDVGDLDKDVSDVGNAVVGDEDPVEAGFDIDIDMEDEESSEGTPIVPMPTPTAPQTPVAPRPMAADPAPTRTDPVTPVWTPPAGKTDTLPFGISADEVRRQVATAQGKRTTTQPMFAADQVPDEDDVAPVVAGTVESEANAAIPELEPPPSETLPFGVSLAEIQQSLSPRQGRSPMDGSSPFAKNALADPPHSDPNLYARPQAEPSGWTTVGPITPHAGSPAIPEPPAPAMVGEGRPADAVDLWTVQNLPGDAIPVVVGNDGGPSLGDDVMADLASLFDDPKKSS